MKAATGVVFAVLGSAAALFGQDANPAQPHTVSYCELSRDPKAYDHQLVRLTAFVTHGFEDFQIGEPDCPTQGFSVWLMYGGKAESNTVYCCPGEAARESRPDSLVIEGVQIPLVDDRIFEQFKDLLKKEADSVVRATVVGTFFAGTRVTYDSSALWRGFGHLGCCSLLAIQRVESFEPHTRNDLDYTEEAGWYENEGCRSASERDLRHISVDNWQGESEKGIAEQERADSGAGWAFADPKRVAIESLQPFYRHETPTLKLVKATSTRKVFRWRSGKRSVVVVVVRPYWLSFYAAGKSVAWVATMIKEAECE